MDRYICVHCHFYQPPRENPWLEEIELQDTAFPFHDWNERITAECYEQNAHSRILDSKGRVRDIVDNYAKISFNFGPTLLHWMRGKAPEVHRAIIEADRKSRTRFSGHGSALAQVYNHMILPLANRRDRYTQVYWGIKDFEANFGRRPEGMWLPETAVDLESLDVMAEQGIAFTILAPHQAHRIRPMDLSEDWTDVQGARIDPTRCYRVNLPSGRSIDVFFYDGPISQSVAFSGVLNNGERFAKKLLGAFHDQRTWPQLVHIATDGETYGHHHRHGDMALAYALDYIETKGLAKLTNYGEYRELHPPTYEAEIIPNTSWSCAHGVERWRTHCGCNSGMKPGWEQHWRGPTRTALDWLRDEVAGHFEREASPLLSDPWQARNEYVDVILDRGEANLNAFLKRFARGELSYENQVRVWKLLELQRHAMLMYTSCGWFFDELSGMETVQCLQYAGRVIQLGQELFSRPLEEEFLRRMEEARSNLPEYGNGRTVYEKFVKPAILDFAKVGAHYAVSSIFEPYDERSRIFSYAVNVKDRKRLEMGKARMLIENAEIESCITRERSDVEFAVVHFGGHNVNAGVRPHVSEQAYGQMAAEAVENFEAADMAQVIRVLDKHFGGTAYSIRSLFRDQQRRILDTVLVDILERVENAFVGLYEEHTPVMRFLNELDQPLPVVYKTIAEFVRNREIIKALESDPVPLEALEALFGDSRAYHLEVDRVMIPLKFQACLERLMEQFYESPASLEKLEAVNQLLEMEELLPDRIHRWKLQNLYFALSRKTDGGKTVPVPEEERPRYGELFASVGGRLGMRVE